MVSLNVYGKVLKGLCDGEWTGLMTQGHGCITIRRNVRDVSWVGKGITEQKKV